MSANDRDSVGEQQGRDGKGRWKKGQSGNPQGRPPGLRHKATIAAEVLLDGQAEALTAKAVEKALEGDVTALRLCLERVCPPRRDRPISIDLPEIQASADAVGASAAILRSVADGEITPDEAASLMKLVEGLARTIETKELEQRLDELERTVMADGAGQ